MAGIGSVTNYFNNHPWMRLGAVGALGTAACKGACGYLRPAPIASWLPWRAPTFVPGPCEHLWSYIQDKALIGTACAAGAYAVYKIAKAYLSKPPTPPTSEQLQREVERHELPTEVVNHILNLSQGVNSPIEPAPFLRRLSKDHKAHQDILLRAAWERIKEIPWDHGNISSPWIIAEAVEIREFVNRMDNFREFRDLLLVGTYALVSEPVPYSEAQIRKLYTRLETIVTNGARSVFRRRVLPFVWNDMMQGLFETYPDWRIAPEALLQEEGAIPGTELDDLADIYWRYRAAMDNLSSGARGELIMNLLRGLIVFYVPMDWSRDGPSISLFEDSLILAAMVLGGAGISILIFDSIRRWMEWRTLSKHMPKLDIWMDNPAHISTFGMNAHVLEAIQMLDLSGCRLKATPSDLTALSGLRTLNLSSNQLRKLSAVLCSLTSLRTLILSNNFIEELSPAVANLNRLTNLDLSHNRISELPLALTRLTNLTALNLSSNRIAAIPPELTQFLAAAAPNLTNNPVTMAL